VSSSRVQGKGAAREVVLPICKRGLVEVAVGVGIIIFLTLPQLDEIFDSNLVLHLAVQHMFLIVGGFVAAQGLDRLVLVVGAFKESVARAYTELLRVNVRFNRRGVLAFVVGGLVVVYSHLPSSFNAALTSEVVHAEMHVALIVAGSLFFVGFKLLTPNMRLLTYILGCKAMSVFGAYLLVSPFVIYGSFPYPEQAQAGTAMIAMCVASDATIIPLWLKRFFSKKA
jgi:cytochrome c oxidase assembly factor CtaG